MISDQKEIRIWGIHTPDHHLFLHGHVIAIGWKDMGDLSAIVPTREAFKEKYVTTYPEEKKGSIATCAGMLYRFVYELQIGDYVIYPSKNDRMINIGIIDGPYTYSPGSTSYVQQRKVKWLKHIPRTAFSQGALHEIGSALTVFSVKNYADEFLAALDKGFKKSVVAEEAEDETVAATAKDIIETTKDFILKELSRQLKGYPFEEFVAALFEAMGYRTRLSPHGGDSGIDIVAYKDELPPRILVQVKSQDAPIKETAIQSLKGAMREGDYGVFVALSSYTPNAKKYLKDTPIIRGIDGSELVDLIYKYYDVLAERFRRMIPLEKVYIPVVRTDTDS